MNTIIASIVATLLALIFAWYKNSSNREDKETWDKFKKLEKEYRETLMNGDPELASIRSKEMQDMREKYKFLEKK